MNLLVPRHWWEHDERRQLNGRRYNDYHLDVRSILLLTSWDVIYSSFIPPGQKWHVLCDKNETWMWHWFYFYLQLSDLDILICVGKTRSKMWDFGHWCILLVKRGKVWKTSELVREKLNENLYRIWKNLMKPIFWRKNEWKLHYVREKILIKTLESKNAGNTIKSKISKLGKDKATKTFSPL